MDRRGALCARQHARELGRAARPVRPRARAASLVVRRLGDAHRRRRPPDDAQPGPGRLPGDRGRVRPHGGPQGCERHGRSPGGALLVLPQADRPDHDHPIPQPPRVGPHHQRVRHAVVAARSEGNKLEKLPDVRVEAAPPVRHLPGPVCLPVQLLSQRVHGRSTGRARCQMEEEGKVEGEGANRWSSSAKPRIETANAQPTSPPNPLLPRHL
mmetsp:Transcript_35522/g.95341  ORF Transcript_35522/g.95341 Transcript_35522/m.95341 type:complete len:212 (-) Transcript_35522:762-1397(-)